MEEKKETFWKRARRRYRLSIMNEKTLEEAGHLNLSLMNVIMLLSLLFVIALAALSLLIVYTPIRTILPGYTENIRQQLIEQSVRLDSLTTSLDVQRKYTDVLKEVMVGEVSSDTIQSLDSLELVMREQLLYAKNEAMEDFMTNYEAKEKDNLQLFAIQQTTPTISFFRPANGVIVDHYDPDNRRFGICLQTQANNAVLAMLNGTVTYVGYDINNTYTIILQHGMYMSVYKNVGKVLKPVGTTVQGGESIALTDSNLPLSIEIWQNGKSINAEEVIVF